MKPLTADKVAEPFFNFLQLAFAGANDPGQIPFESSHSDAVMARIASGEALSIREAMLLPAGERRALKELLTQYVMFLTMFNDLTFPHDFLSGTNETRLGTGVLAYVAKHRWPFPQRLPWSMNA